MYLGYVFIYYESLSSFHDIKKNCSMAMKVTPLINSLRMAFYLLAFDVRHLCMGHGRTQSQALSLCGPRQIACKISGETILQKILTAGQ